MINSFAKTLGPGPYKFIGVGRIVKNDTHGARYFGPEVDEGCGTCAHCGAGIMNVFVIERPNGRRYGVGSTCIAKASYDPALEKAAKASGSKERKRRKAKARDCRYHVWKSHKSVESHMEAIEFHSHTNSFLKSIWEFWLERRYLSVRQCEAVSRVLAEIQTEGQGDE